MRVTKPGTKGEATKAKILNGAIYCIATYGLHNTSFQKIADQCGVSQPLVVHYFKKKEEIFPTALNLVFDRAAALTQQQLDQTSNPMDQLREYLLVSLQIFRETPEFARFYLQFYYLSGFDDRIKELNTSIKNRAVTRIHGILARAKEQGRLRDDLDVNKAAKTIHNCLTGVLINSVTEFPQFTDSQLLNSLETIIEYGVFQRERSRLDA